MSQNQEIIESKLCAFIDDELDEEGRAEIERHLLANPQHRRLLEELRRTSGLVRTLPRETAPAELAESFNGQLERSVLLHGLGDSESGSTTGNTRWPQMALLAAILFLTIGLAGVVYVILPSLTHRPQIVQSISRPLTVPAAQSGPGSGDGQGAATSADAVGTDSKRAEKAEKPGLRPERATRAGRQGGIDRNLDLDQAAKTGEIASIARLRDLAKQAASDPQFAQLAANYNSNADAPADGAVRSDARAGGLGDNALVMLVQAANLDQARQELKDYFDANKIPWDAAISDAEAAAPLLARNLRDNAGLSGAATEPTHALIAPAAAQKEVTLADGLADKQDAVEASKAKGQSEKAPATSPDAGVASAGANRKVVADAEANAPANLNANGTVDKDNKDAASANNATTAPAARVYLACRMTRKQAEYVGSILSHEGVAQHVQIVAAPPREIDAASQLTLKQAASSGPDNLPGASADAARRNELAAAPGVGGSGAATRDSVAAGGGRGSDGTVSTPGAPPVAAATASAAPPAPALAALPDESLSTTAPSTLRRQQSQEQQQQAAGDIAQTQPALSLQAPAAPVVLNPDDAIDVVIVLQPAGVDTAVPATDPVDALIPLPQVKADAAPDSPKASAATPPAASLQPVTQPAK